jgi:hypothetical protein
MDAAMGEKTFWERVKDFWSKKWDPNENQKIIHNYFTHRQLIGILGWTLPLVLGVSSCLSGTEILSSISDYYYSHMRDYMVGALCCASFFLIIYNGNRRIDYWITTATGIFGFGAALFPCLNNSGPSNQLVGIWQIPQCCSRYIHLTSAGLFFLLLAINSSFLFIHDAKDSDPDEDFGIDTKKFRNGIYVSSGVIILISLVILGALKLFCHNKNEDNGIIDFVFETVMLVFFGLSWSVKGKALKHLVGKSNLKVKFQNLWARPINKGKKETETE